MKNLAARFSSHQYWNGRHELRLLPRSIYRYEPVEGTILDGEVYALVNGTNPEILLLIEAHQTAQGPAQWKVSFGTLAGAKCVVLLDEQEIWTCERDTGTSTDPRKFLVREVPIPEHPVSDDSNGR